MIDQDTVYQYLSKQRLAVISSVSESGSPESALIGVGVTPGLEIVFDTLDSSRKYKNIIQNPIVSLVIGWDNEISVQYEGIATLLTDADEYYREVYYDAYPDGRDRASTWRGLVQFKVSPKWIRYSNFNEPVLIEESWF
jgi:general stress protein 26